MADLYPGYYCPAGSNVPLPCTPGWYCPSAFLGTPYAQCQQGFYCTLAATSSTPTDNYTGLRGGEGKGRGGEGRGGEGRGGEGRGGEGRGGEGRGGEGRGGEGRGGEGRGYNIL